MSVQSITVHRLDTPSSCDDCSESRDYVQYTFNTVQMSQVALDIERVRQALQRIRYDVLADSVDNGLSHQITVSYRRGSRDYGVPPSNLDEALKNAVLENSQADEVIIECRNEAIANFLRKP